MKLTGLVFTELEDWVTGVMEMKPYRALQLFSWIHRRRVREFECMTDISLAARERLSASADITVLAVRNSVMADDGTVKHAFTLEDGEVIEAVLIPDPPRLTACISTQAGCRFGCRFCRTGREGFRRNLAADEIVAQLYGLQDSSRKRITNVVFMGMGEPFDNFPNLKSALSVFTDERGACIGARRITVSTVGLPGGIPRLIELGKQYGLAVSLHSAVEETRRSLVPVSRGLPLPELRSQMTEYTKATGRRVTIEYCLISGVNDTSREAEALAGFTRGLQCKINLIEYNPVQGSVYERPYEDATARFMEYLYPRCQTVTLRRSRGCDISAACGQLGTGGN